MSIFRRKRPQTVETETAPVNTPVKLAVVYYSSTGTIAAIAQELSTVAEKAGAEVRLLKVAELAPQAAIDSNPAWAANATATADIPVATPDDIEWADAVIFGSPTRFGNITSQLKQFIDTLGGLWAEGKLADKVYSGFTSSATTHGGQESTLLALYNSVHHFGGIVVAPGYTDAAKFADGNPYGTSHVDAQGNNPVDDTTRAAARVQAERERRLSLNLTHCKTPDSTTPRCEAERARNFAAARNAEIEASIAMVEAMRAVRKARDAQIASSLAAAKAERARKFQIARNAEIEASVARVDAARARGEIVAVSDLEPIETGAINFDDLPTRVVAKPVLRSTSVMRPCRAAHYLASPLHFSTASANLDDDMKTRLDQLAVVAKACPRISIEVHGHSDGSGPVQINRSMAERRANAAIDYLVAAGVERKRLTAIGHGAMDPMMPNTNAASRAINRRVEIDIKDPVSEVAQKIMGDLAELLDPTYKPQLARLTP